MQRLVEAGAEGIILGCTEIALLVGPADAPVPLFDTTALHARSAALGRWAMRRSDRRRADRDTPESSASRASWWRWKWPGVRKRPKWPRAFP